MVLNADEFPLHPKGLRGLWPKLSGWEWKIPVSSEEEELDADLESRGMQGVRLDVRFSRK